MPESASTLARVPLIGEQPSVDIPMSTEGCSPIRGTRASVDADSGIWAAAFIMQANTTLVQIQRLLSRQRSMVLYTDKFQASKNWVVNDQKLRIIGETWGYLELTVQRKGARIKVPTDGNFEPIILGAISDTAMAPQSLASLSSTKTGRAAVGHVLNSGEVKLDALNSGRDILVNDIISLAGPFPLDDWIDSEV
jgi:hypothetical protein